MKQPVDFSNMSRKDVEDYAWSKMSSRLKAAGLTEEEKSRKKRGFWWFWIIPVAGALGLCLWLFAVNRGAASANGLRQDAEAVRTIENTAVAEAGVKPHGFTTSVQAQHSEPSGEASQPLATHHSASNRNVFASETKIVTTANEESTQVAVRSALISDSGPDTPSVPSFIPPSAMPESPEELKDIFKLSPLPLRSVIVLPYSDSCCFVMPDLAHADISGHIPGQSRIHFKPRLEVSGFGVSDLGNRVGGGASVQFYVPLTTKMGILTGVGYHAFKPLREDKVYPVAYEDISTQVTIIETNTAGISFPSTQMVDVISESMAPISRQDYLSVPVRFCWSPLTKFRFSAGAELAWQINFETGSVNSSYNLDGNFQIMSRTTMNAIRNWDACGLVGVTWTPFKHLHVNLDYHHGFVDILKSKNTSLYNRYIALGAGVNF